MSARRSIVRGGALVLVTLVASIGWAPKVRVDHAVGQVVGDSVDWKAVEGALGRSGALQPGNVYKFGIPRSDLKVQVGPVVVRPALALGSWIAFKPEGNGAVAMGDLVLLEAEVGPVIQALQAAGVQPTAVHNHLLNETPQVRYLHFEAHGDAVQIARALHAALARTGTPPAASTTAPPPALDLDTTRIVQLLGVHGKANGGVYQVSVPRQEVVRSGGMEIPPAMGVATAINFQSTGTGKAAITGDFVLVASEVAPVMRALGEHGIAVTALHSHMLTEEPRLLFMHFWANDDVFKLATGLRAALALMNVKS